MLYCSKVVINGGIASINAETRDVTVLTKTPKGKAVSTTVHFWKVQGVDSDDDVHAGRANWKDQLAVGDSLTIVGHMGNNGRIIATNFIKEDSLNEVAEGLA